MPTTDDWELIKTIATGGKGCKKKAATAAVVILAGSAAALAVAGHAAMGLL